MVFRTLDFNGVAHEVCFNSTAMYTLEGLVTPQTVDQFRLRMGIGRGGMRDWIHLLVAGLEGARVKRQLTAPPWTVASVNDLVDAVGGYEELTRDGGPLKTALEEAWVAAFPVSKAKADQQRADAKAGQRAGETTGTAGGQTIRPTASTGATTGSASSTTPARSGSRKTRSGGSRSAKSTTGPNGSGPSGTATDARS